MLNDIQEQAFRLWNDFLEPDFGLNLNLLHFRFQVIVVSTFTIVILVFFILTQRLDKRLYLTYLVLILILRWF